MNTLRNLSIATRLAGAFAIILALLAVVAGIAFWATTSMAGSTHEIAAVAAVKAQAADTVEGMSSYIHESQTRFVLDSGSSYNDHLGDVKDFKSALATLAHDSVTPADRAKLAAIQKAFATVRHFDLVLYAATKAGKITVAKGLVEGAANDAADALAGAASSYLAAANAEEATAVANFNSARSLATWLMIASTARRHPRRARARLSARPLDPPAAARDAARRRGDRARATSSSRSPSAATTRSERWPARSRA